MDDYFYDTDLYREWSIINDLRDRIRRLPDEEYVKMFNHIMREYNNEYGCIMPNTPETINKLGTPYEVLQLVRRAVTYDDTHPYIMRIDGGIRTLEKGFGFNYGIGSIMMTEYILEHDGESLKNLEGWEALRRIR